MKTTLKKFVSGFTIVEIMVAMVVLAIGLLGMAGMTMMVVRGNRGASDLTSATNICQLKVEELKDVNWVDLGRETFLSADRYINGVLNGALAQEGSVDAGAGLNAQGNTRAAQFTIERANTPCSTVGSYPPAVGSDCDKRLNDLGPYRYARTFVICKGTDYTGSSGAPVPPTSPTDTRVEAAAVTGVLRPDVEPDCRVSASNNLTRSKWLACKPEDISTTPGSGNREKKIKVLCAWRSSDGVCRSVHLDTTVVNFQ